MKRFTFWRNAIVSETYVIEADSEEQALEQLSDGCCDPIHTEWMDWASDDYELEAVEELDPLYRMVKDYPCVTS